MSALLKKYGYRDVFISMTTSVLKTVNMGETNNNFII